MALAAGLAPRRFSRTVTCEQRPGHIFILWMVSSHGSVDSERKEGQGHITVTDGEVLLARKVLD